jgi:2-polyprenyl-3-methyl-5-hydroxy-6-metoxy-1,4-benzoquinol methylase
MASQLDPQAKQALIGSYTAGALISAMMAVGVRLGLYETMRDLEPMTSDDLAERTGLHERWLREWLQGQAAAKVLEYSGDNRFWLSPESAALLADRESLRSMEGMIESLPDRLALVPRVEEAFRTGQGFSVDDRGESAARGIEGLLANWHRTVLIPTAIPALPIAEARLRSGALGADVGCGSGVAILELAQAFPQSQFHGYDVSQQMLTAAARNRDLAGVGNVEFHDVRSEPLPDDHRFDFVMTFDCLHDMAFPQRTAEGIHAAIQPDGVWFISDIDARPSFEENLRELPGAASMYSISILACMASSLSEPGAVGYGTLGMPEVRLRSIVEEAGFTRFRRIDSSSPEFAAGSNAFYEVRP